MTPIEAAIVETLQKSGPCCLDNVVTSLPTFSWGEIFDAVDQMSRDGRVSLRRMGTSAYQVSLKNRGLTHFVRGRESDETTTIDKPAANPR